MKRIIILTLIICILIGLGLFEPAFLKKINYLYFRTYNSPLFVMEIDGFTFRSRYFNIVTFTYLLAISFFQILLVNFLLIKPKVVKYFTVTLFTLYTLIIILYSLSYFVHYEKVQYLHYLIRDRLIKGPLIIIFFKI